MSEVAQCGPFLCLARVMVGPSPCLGLLWLCCGKAEWLPVFPCSHTLELFAHLAQVMLYYCLHERRKAKKRFKKGE